VSISTTRILWPSIFSVSPSTMTTGPLFEKRQVEVAHKPGLSGQMIELSEEEWRRQFDPAWKSTSN
jgi:hypothetical protein